jgi:hypothetical protein
MVDFRLVRPEINYCGSATYCFDVCRCPASLLGFEARMRIICPVGYSTGHTLATGGPWLLLTTTKATTL